MQSVPIDVVLLGAASAKQTKLTHKQRAFAEGIAMGKTKAQAYRDPYDSQGKPETQSRRGQELVADGRIQAQIDALTLANEARKYATPAALRSLVIERLTATAIDDDIKPAQRLRALELLGKVTEVAAFTERREIIKTESAGDARQSLLTNLRAALRSSAIDVQALPVVAQESDPGAVRDAQASDPTEGPSPEAAERSAPTLLSNPHTESPDISVPTHLFQDAPIESDVTAVTHADEADVTCVTPGVVKNPPDMTDSNIENTPLGNWK